MFIFSQERDKIREEEERKYEKAQRDLEAKLNLKEMQLQEMINKQNTLEEKLNTVYKEVPEIKDENAHLIRERDLLQRQVTIWNQIRSYQNEKLSPNFFFIFLKFDPEYTEKLTDKRHYSKICKTIWMK